MREKISRDTKRGQLADAEKGNSSGGTAPFGLRRAAIDKTTRVLKRVLMPGEHKSIADKVTFVLGPPEEVRAVQEMFTLAEHHVGLGPFGDKFHKSAATIRAILTNPAYLGWRVYNKVSHDPSRCRFVRNDLSKWVIVKNAHPAIITERQFDAVQKTRTTRPRTGAHKQSCYLLTGLIKCEHCGFTFCGVTRTRKNKTKGVYR